MFISYIVIKLLLIYVGIYLDIKLLIYVAIQLDIY
jgi:hypothetical protein